MQRHEQVIQLSDHIKNKLKQSQYSPVPSPLNNSSDEFADYNGSNEDENGISHFLLLMLTKESSKIYSFLFDNRFSLLYAEC